LGKSTRAITATTSPWSITTERIATAGVLAGITILLGVIPGIGFIPLPNISGNATTEHIPTILGGVVAGPLVGIISGFVFGLVSFLHPAGAAFFKDPTVSILPRLFIGLVSWAVFAGLVRFNRSAAAAIAGLAGSATNTVLVLTMLVIRGYIPVELIVTIIPQAVIEAIIASILTVALAHVFYILEARLVRAPETKSRDQLPY
jgi:uncharacterized membrane protein